MKTIAAISTPRGKGGIAVIRISGCDAVAVAERMFLTKSTKVLSDAAPRRAVFGEIVGTSGAVCDEGIAVIFRAPASYTGEDTVEISCHGGVAVTNEVLLSAVAHGASLAGPGEFTRRAFINGKLSLTEAEAVGMLIDADTKERLILSGGAQRGNVSREIGEISRRMLGTMTALYAAIDYPEEDVGDEGEREIKNTLLAALSRVNALLMTYKVGRAVRDGVRCTVCGRPNVGKSSLFNLMTGEESAIVTSIAGTTRDVLRETVSFGGITLNLCDTAGLRESGDDVEQIGITRAEREIKTAELVIAVFDGGEELTEEDYDLISMLGKLTASVISVINKADLTCRLTDDALNKIKKVSAEVVNVSVKDGGAECAAALSSAVAHLFGSDRINLSADAVIFDARQREALLHAQSALEGAVRGIEAGDPLDCVCTLAEEALSALEETDGRGVDEKIISEIFSRFCVGK